MKYTLLLCSTLALVSASALKCSPKLLDAIEAQDIEEVKHLVKNHETLTVDQKEKCLKAAHEIVQECKEKTESLFRSGYDLLKVGVGGFFGVFSTLGALGNLVVGLNAESLWKNNPELHEKYTFEQIKIAKKRTLIASGVNAGIAALSWWLFSRGWTMNSAHSALDKARKIEKHIEEASVL